MQEAEQLIIEALSTYGIPPAAAKNLIRRAMARVAPGEASKRWLQLARGPLVEEIRQVIPVFQVNGPYAEAVAKIEQLARARRPKTPPTSGRENLQLDPNDPRSRQDLLRHLAREEGVVGVMLLGPTISEARFPGGSANLPRLLFAAHRLALSRRGYRFAYLVTREAQIFLRPLEAFLVAVITRPEVNLGKIRKRLTELSLKGGPR